MNIALYKKLEQRPHINEALVAFLTSYCLTLMSNEEKKFDTWHIGICESESQLPENAKHGRCSSHLEALETKEYLVKEKNMQDVNSDITGNEDIIYVYR